MQKITQTIKYSNKREIAQLGSPTSRDTSRLMPLTLMCGLLFTSYLFELKDLSLSLNSKDISNIGSFKENSTFGRCESSISGTSPMNLGETSGRFGSKQHNGTRNEGVYDSTSSHRKTYLGSQDFSPQNYDNTLYFGSSDVISAEKGMSPDSSFPIVFESRKVGYSNTLVKIWSKDDLKLESVGKIESIFNKIIIQISSFILSIEEKNDGTSSKSGIKYFHNINKEIEKEAYFYKLASIDDMPERKQGDSKALAYHIRSKATVEASSRLNNSVPFIEKMKSGLNFNLGISGASAQNKSKKIQKYGLILKEIKPASNSSNRASTSTLMEEELQFAGKSKVVWTIGPVSQESKKLFSVNYSEIADIKDKSTWDKISLPTLDFKIKIVPASNNIRSYIGSNDPGFVFSATQVENIYMLSYATKSKKGKPSATHTFKIPVAGKMELSRIYNTDLEPVKTRLDNILVLAKAPTVNLIYTDPEQFYLIETSHSIRDHKLSFGAERRLINITEKTPDSRYRANYSYSF